MSKRNYAIEFYRFLFSLIVCIFHFSTYMSNGKASGFPFDSGYLVVEFFFMLSGIFLAQSTEKKQSLSLKEKADASISYFFQRYSRLYPHYLFTILCMAVVRILVVHNLTVAYWLRKGIIEILMLQSAGTGKLLSFVFWFASAMVMASFFVYFLRVLNAKVCNALFPLVALAIYSSFLQKYGTFNVTFTYNFLFSDGFWRALAGTMTGCLCYEVIRYLRRFDLSNKKFLFTIIEALLLVVILFALCKTRYREKNYTLTLMLGLFLVLIFSQTSHLSDLLNNRLSQYLGKISYAIYLNQILVYTVLFNCFSVSVRIHPRRATLIYLFCVVLLSVVTTWIVEKLGCLAVNLKNVLRKRHSNAV